MDQKNKSLLDVKMMSFGYMKNLDDIQNFCFPPLIEHLPPDFLTQLKEYKDIYTNATTIDNEKV